MRRFTAVLAALALVVLTSVPAMAAPGIRFTTQLVEDETVVAGLGTTASPFVITTAGVPGVMHSLQTWNTTSRPGLLPIVDPFYLVAGTAQQATLTTYFAAKGWPQPYLDYMAREIAGTAPFFDLAAGAGNGYFLADGFHADSGFFEPGMYGLQIDDDYPTGTYTYTGVLNGRNHTHITFTFVMRVVRS